MCFYYYIKALAFVSIAACTKVNQNIYNIYNDLAPTGYPYVSYTVSRATECGSSCTLDPACHRYALNSAVLRGAECHQYKCTEAQGNTTRLGWTTYVKEVPPAPPCPAGYVREPCTGHCYSLQTPMLMQYALENCNTSLPGAYLCEIQSQTENDFVFGLLYNGQSAWLGGRVSAGALTWIHSGAVGYGYTNWEYGKPGRHDMCVMMNSLSHGRWSDFPGHFYPLHSVCEFDNGQP